MAKIPRKVQKIFGNTAGSTGITKFGSTASGTTEYSTDVKEIQSTTAYSGGWQSAVLAGVKRKPVYQDRNALDYLFSSQLANIFQDGSPIYDADTTYYIGSIVRQDGTSIYYKSLTDDNTGNLLTNTSHWLECGDLSDLKLINTSNLPINYINGLIPSNNILDANNDINVSVGKCRDDSNTVDIVLNSIMTKQLDAIFAEGSNAGGLDTGTKAISTWYYIFVISKANGTTDVLFSLSANSPTMPTGFIYKKRLKHGAIYTDGSGHITPFYINNLYNQFKTIINNGDQKNIGTSYANVTMTAPPNSLLYMNTKYVNPTGFTPTYANRLDKVTGTVYSDEVTGGNLSTYNQQNWINVDALSQIQARVQAVPENYIFYSLGFRLEI